MGRQRWGAAVLAVVASALTVTGVVLAATDPNPGSLAKDPLILNGYPPRSANLLVTLSAGSSFGVSAEVNVNFVSGRAEAEVELPVAVASVEVDARLIEGDLYLRSAAVSDGPWYRAHVGTLPFFGLSLELTKPDIDLITGYTKETTQTSGYSTTHTFYFAHVAVTPLFAARGAESQIGSVTWSITTGSQGEVSASTLLVKTRGVTTDVTATIQSYNQPVHVRAPSLANVEKLKESAIEKILAAATLKHLFIPSELTSLGKGSLA